MLAVRNAKFPCLVLMQVLVIWTWIMCNPLLVKDLMSWTCSSVIFLLNTNGSMSNLLLFITSLFIVIQWLILKGSKSYSRCSNWRMLEGNIGVIHLVGAWERSCTLCYWMLPKMHLHLLLTLAFLLMKSWQLIILNGCPSICMLSRLGRGFQSSSVLKQLRSLPLLITYLFWWLKLVWILVA